MRKVREEKRRCGVSWADGRKPQNAQHFAGFGARPLRASGLGRPRSQAGAEEQGRLAPPPPAAAGAAESSALSGRPAGGPEANPLQSARWPANVSEGPARSLTALWVSASGRTEAGGLNRPWPQEWGCFLFPFSGTTSSFLLLHVLVSGGAFGDQLGGPFQWESAPGACVT